MIGQRDPVAENRTGDRERRFARAERRRQAVDVGYQRFMQRRELSDADMPQIVVRTVFRHRETRVAAADIADKPQSIQRAFFQFQQSGTENQ